MSVSMSHPLLSYSTLTASTLNNLAALYRIQGRYTEANPLFERPLLQRRAAHSGLTAKTYIESFKQMPKVEP
jgi:hypothetical protein